MPSSLCSLFLGNGSRITTRAGLRFSCVASGSLAATYTYASLVWLIKMLQNILQSDNEFFWVPTFVICLGVGDHSDWPSRRFYMVLLEQSVLRGFCGGAYDSLFQNGRLLQDYMSILFLTTTVFLIGLDSILVRILLFRIMLGLYINTPDCA